MKANGGTEMLAPMKAALVDASPNDKIYLRQIVFITDGAIGNEQELFDTIAKGRGRTRVFMVGIGSAPNSYLMTRAAEAGHLTARGWSRVLRVARTIADLEGAPSVRRVHVAEALIEDDLRGHPAVGNAAIRRHTGLGRDQRMDGAGGTPGRGAGRAAAGVPRRPFSPPHRGGGAGGIRTGRPAGGAAPGPPGPVPDGAGGTREPFVAD